MSTDTFQIQVCTPAGMMLHEVSNSVTLPGTSGEIGILPQHRKFVSLLAGGILTYFSANTHEVKNLLIAEGVCSFAGDTLLVLTDEVEFPHDVDPMSYADERQNLVKVIAAGDFEDPERVIARRKLRRIESIDKLLGR